MIRNVSHFRAINVYEQHSAKDLQDTNTGIFWVLEESHYGVSFKMKSLTSSMHQFSPIKTL